MRIGTQNPKIKILSSVQQSNSNQQQPIQQQQNFQNQQQIQNWNQPAPQGQQQQQGSNSNIKFKEEAKINNSRANEFENLFSRVQSDIDSNEAQFNLSPYIQDDSVIYQFWRFEFCGQGNFQGRAISGVLKFQSDHPMSAPIFYFDPVKTDQGDEVLQHENIYGDHTLCIPLFSHWKKTTTEYEILQAIVHIFHNPNWSETDAPANPMFSKLEHQEKQQIQLRQAQYLEYFCKTS
ncbi:unnamed protein product [Paramecium pentaurelia]|uniref:UBC core domain-containing protein n=1 Tax=Paramecium pentaurelia TaxID=43138 RepID=A0A8S1SKU2_9CILI|nr:unnamed protein product [Paramecium pentaurelia]